MRFETLWNCDLGATVTVENGWPQPAALDGPTYRRWQAQNFTGVLSGKGTDARGRWLSFDITPAPGVVVTRTLWEGYGHRFATSGLSASALAAYAEELLEGVDGEAGGQLSLIDGLLLYAKWQEVRDINSIGLAGVQALTVAEREARFPFLTAELNENPALTGQQAVDRFTAQTTNKIARAARIEARRSRIARLLAAANTQEGLETAVATGWTGV